MTKPSLSRTCASLAMILLASGGLPAEDNGQTLRKLTAADRSSLTLTVDASVLPPGASHVVVDRSQVMVLSTPQLTRLLPVRYEIANPGGGSAPFFQCGILFSRPNEAGRFVVTFGKDWTEAESCSGLRAIGAVGPGKQSALPRLGLIYEGSSPNTAVTEPVLLSPTPEGVYEPDAETSQWLGQSSQGHTIAGIRQLLVRRGRSQAPER